MSSAHRLPDHLAHLLSGRLAIAAFRALYSAHKALARSSAATEALALELSAAPLGVHK